MLKTLVPKFRPGSISPFKRYSRITDSRKLKPIVDDFQFVCGNSVGLDVTQAKKFVQMTLRVLEHALSGHFIG